MNHALDVYQLKPHVALMSRSKQHNHDVWLQGSMGLWCVAGFDQSYNMTRFLKIFVVLKFCLWGNLHVSTSGTQADLTHPLMLTFAHNYGLICKCWKCNISFQFLDIRSHSERAIRQRLPVLQVI